MITFNVVTRGLPTSRHDSPEDALFEASYLEGQGYNSDIVVSDDEPLDHLAPILFGEATAVA